MKYFLVAIFLFWVAGLTAQQDVFEKGIKSFESGEYDEAISLFEEVLSTGVHSSDLYFNLGLAYHRSGNLGKAVLNLERALKLNPKHRESKMALPELMAEIEEPVTRIEAFILWRWYRSTINFMSSDAWAMSQLIFGVGFVLVCYYLFFLSGGRTAWIWALLISCAIGFGWSWYASTQKRSLEIGGGGGIIMMPRATVLSAPDERSEVVTEVTEGTKVYILDQIGDWLKIQLEDRDIGWMEQKKVEII